MQKSLINIEPSFVANNQPTKPVEPSKGTLYEPPVPAQFLATLHSSSGDTRGDASLSQVVPASPEIVPFVRHAT
jgi:hypothetical protein